jgi:uncharacterized protein (DUF2147 family)
MKTLITAVALSLLTISTAFAQDVFGKWKTVDDNTGEAKSILEIYKVDGKAYGRVFEILNKEHKYDLCTACEGADKDAPIEGLVIMKNLEEDNDEWNEGTIVDPESGKEYDCYIKLESKEKLKIRGYIGFAVLGRTQYWYRVE